MLSLHLFIHIVDISQPYISMHLNFQWTRNYSILKLLGPWGERSSGVRRWASGVRGLSAGRWTARRPSFAGNMRAHTPSTTRDLQETETTTNAQPAHCHAKGCEAIRYQVVFLLYLYTSDPPCLHTNADMHVLYIHISLRLESLYL